MRMKNPDGIWALFFFILVWFLAYWLYWEWSTHGDRLERHSYRTIYPAR